VLLILFGVGPALYALALAFSSYTAGKPNYLAAGLGNFAAVVRDFRFADAFLHAGQYLLVSLPVAVIGVSLVALLLHARHDRLAGGLRTMYFVPGALAGPVVVLLAIFMFDPLISPFEPLLRALGMNAMSDVARADRLPALFTVMAFFVGAGAWIAIFYGALNGISQEVIEAATMDGASPVRLALSIKLPLIGPYIVYMLILTFAVNVQLFVEPQLLSYVRGLTVNRYWSPNQLSYAFAFELGQFGYAAAISLILLAIGLIGAILIIRRTGFFRADTFAS
jgi:multiple sugar transport system permease protein